MVSSRLTQERKVPPCHSEAIAGRDIRGDSIGIEISLPEDKIRSILLYRDRKRGMNGKNYACNV